MERGQRGVENVLAKLDNSIDEGNYYEAHQMYRTLYFRYTRQKKFEECLNLLFNGAKSLISKKQETSGADLGLLLLDTLEKRGNNQDAELWMQNLGVIIKNLSASTVERETIIHKAIKWSGDMSANFLGHPTMHKLMAEIYWSEDNIEQARHHYLLCKDGRICGRILIKINTLKGYKKEADLFICQAVLQQLCLKDSKTAESTFLTYTTNHPEIRRNEAPFHQPLLNFIYLLFRCIDLGRGDSFKALRQIYRPSLKRDASFDKYLVKIGVLFFGINPPTAGFMGGMFGDLFSRLFQGFDDDDDEGTTEPISRIVTNGSAEQRSGRPGRGGAGDNISNELD